jgi:hypothetical protein
MKSDHRELLFVIGLGMASFIVIILTGVYMETKGFGTW